VYNHSKVFKSCYDFLIFYVTNTSSFIWDLLILNNMLLSFLILLPLSGILVLIMLEPALIRPSQNDIYPKYTKTPFLSDPHNLEDEEIINLNN